MAARKRKRGIQGLGRPIERVGDRAQGDAEDLFAQLLLLGWVRLVGVLLLVYLSLNLLFAALFWLERGSIANSTGTLAEAFHFSVQTLATIGYGALAPATPWANGLVVVEAFVGILFSAAATGVVFAKFARPRPRVLFSRTCVVHQRDGVDTLCFRVGNLRSVEIVEASVKVSVLRTHVTQEGDRMRRFYDLELVRDRSPVFAVGWMIMHRIDEKSPLWGVSSEDLVADDIRLLVSLTGIDDTYAQTVYCRHQYDPDEVLFGVRFADVMHALPGKGLRVDFNRFHDVEPARPSVVPSSSRAFGV